MNPHAGPNGTIEVKGANLRYRIEGSGRPVLVIGSAAYYARTVSRQLRESFRMAFVDVRHFAEAVPSGTPDRITLETYIDDIEQVRRAIGLERFIVIGHSHHGNLALEYARRFPQNVSHVVLVGSPPCDVKTTIERQQRKWLRPECVQGR